MLFFNVILNIFFFLCRSAAMYVILTCIKKRMYLKKISLTSHAFNSIKILVRGHIARPYGVCFSLQWWLQTFFSFFDTEIKSDSHPASLHERETSVLLYMNPSNRFLLLCCSFGSMEPQERGRVLWASIFQTATRAELQSIDIHRLADAPWACHNTVTNYVFYCNFMLQLWKDNGRFFRVVFIFYASQNQRGDWRVAEFVLSLLYSDTS